MGTSRQEKEQRRDLALVRTFMVEGLETHEICARLGYSHDEFDRLLVKFHESEAAAVRAISTERLYADYVRDQSRNIHDLTQLMGSFTPAQGGSAVSAIRARADIYDRIIARGQEFGFVAKVPEAKIVAGVLMENLTNKQLRITITEELQHLGSLMTRYGGGQGIIDVDPGPIYQPTPKAKALPPAAGKTAQRSSNKVHRGRRVVKEPIH